MYRVPLACILLLVTHAAARRNESELATPTGVHHSVADDYANGLAHFWDRTTADFAHIDYRYRGGETALLQYWSRNWLGRVPRELGHVVEYGIGGGLLGATLLASDRARTYTGIDVSSRQLKEAKKRLQTHFEGKFRLVLASELDRTHLVGATTFVCQAVIQHFPDVEYFYRFLQQLDTADSSLQLVMLQTREGIAQRGPHRTVQFALSVDPAEMVARLSTYRHVWRTGRESNGYVHHLFHRK